MANLAQIHLSLKSFLIRYRSLLLKDKIAFCTIPFRVVTVSVIFLTSVIAFCLSNYPTASLFVFFRNFAGIGRSSCHMIFIGLLPSCLT